MNATLPDTGFVRQTDLLGCPERPGRPAKPRIIPFAASTLWAKVKAGQFPAPVKLSAGVTAWRVEDVREWIASRGQS